MTGQGYGMAPKIYQAIAFNKLRPRQNGRHFVGNVFKCIFVIEEFCILLPISLNFVPTIPIEKSQHWFR